MAIEIERKFLVKKELWNQLTKPTPTSIRQGYISKEASKTVRVRTKGDRGFLTIKGKTTGASRTEFEYEIPLADALDLLAHFCPVFLEKDRYELVVGQHTWEIDVFHGKLAPLILAEIELSDENESFELPEWISEEVTYDPQYFNAKLVEKIDG